MNKHEVIETAYKMIVQETHYCENMSQFGLYVTGVTDLASELVKMAEAETEADAEKTKAAIEEVKKAEAKPQRETRKSTKNGVDVARIKELWEGGAKASQIAEEVGCSQQSVYNHVMKFKQEAKA